MDWLNVFSMINSPVIAYFDTKRDLEHFEKLRKVFPSNLTKSVLISRDSLWSFGLISNISKLFADPKYPKHHPNTVVPEYGIVMHAKYELMLKSLLNNPFKTKYFCWLDVLIDSAI